MFSQTIFFFYDSFAFSTKKNRKKKKRKKFEQHERTTQKELSIRLVEKYFDRSWPKWLNFFAIVPIHTHIGYACGGCKAEHW